jgi:hypothetical protein
VPQALVAMVPRDPRRNVLIMMGSASMLLSRYLLTSQRCGRSVASSVASRRRCHDLRLRSLIATLVRIGARRRQC